MRTQKNGSSEMAKVVEDIIQALNNLGGQARLEDIYAEVELIRTEPLPKNWKANIRGIIGNHSSASKRFLGVEYFYKVGRGVWALKKQAEIYTPQRKPKNSLDFDKYTIPESFDTIRNTLKTIKEYRDFSNPASPTWVEYVQEFFHLMGFSTKQQEERLFLLSDLGGRNNPIAIVGYIFPDEHFEVISPGITWKNYLYYAAHYHHTHWGILTNGLQLQVIHFHDENDPPQFWPNLDEIITDGKMDSYFAIYKIFSFIKGYRGELLQVSVRNGKRKTQRSTKRTRQSSSAMPKVLSNILDVCQVLDRNGGYFNQACRTVAKGKGLSPTANTVQDACTRRIGINTEHFYKLYANKPQLIEFLVGQFPNYSEEIKKAISV